MAKKITLPKRKTKEKIHFFDYENILETGGLKLPRVELFSNKKVLIEKCSGINEYSDNLINLNVGERYMIFLGKNLKISSFEGKNLVITGEIETINFIK